MTVNDYLARRDAEWMAPIYRALGVTVGAIQESDTPADRKAIYAQDVTYGTNSEFGFDYLRDNMASSLENCVQRGHEFAIVDEVDNILIDEARTPLIISGRPEQAADTYYSFARLAKQLKGEESKPKLKSLGESKDTSEADTTTSTTRSTRPWRRPRAGCTGPSSSSGSRTSMSRSTGRSSTTSSRRSRPSRSTSATRTTP